MANIKLKGLGINQFGGMAAYGNVTTLRAVLETDATGAAVRANATTPLGVGDKVYLQSLPAGFRLEDLQLIVSTAMTAAVTGSLGFEYADGVDSADVPQDLAYFGTGLVLNAAARLRTTSSKAPVTLAKEAFLVLTLAGAANAKASRVDFIVHGERLGAK
ncbi:hypothetical protein ABL840_26740 [Variovorax sp. NFACC27]|uniref:hypothetical protein n=1 Tax=unclassified Variovorax TaxID=663243 RepID=UPI00089D4456|nr:hypothetical protein SAMN03159371_03701 [Variovorax sp. NFACC28]SEG78146.1 hypothetical protein SAMN03159365_03780 [Variovorax sp. NFACC29]SFC95790.1 hypothetical protein SAMN03159379_03643 [Variovorax sp. NFACC26]SFG08935.1 hypothetical protein SAMN03159447_01751 [Variovorax sp. NFACC27]